MWIDGIIRSFLLSNHPRHGEFHRIEWVPHKIAQFRFQPTASLEIGANHIPSCATYSWSSRNTGTVKSGATFSVFVRNSGLLPRLQFRWGYDIHVNLIVTAHYLGFNFSCFRGIGRCVGGHAKPHLQSIQLNKFHEFSTQWVLLSLQVCTISRQKVWTYTLFF